MRRSSQLSSYVLVPALLLGVLTACWSSTSAWATSGSSGDPGDPDSSSVISVNTVNSVSCSGNSCSSSSVSIASCSGDACTVTLSGNSVVAVLDATFSVAGIENGRATLRVDDQDVSCTQGQSVSVGSLRLTCTRVTGDTVTFTASRA
jgi:hypothetical protein